ncbi:MAG: helix-turn-helix transcriptional regulator [Solirubrobacterales bacterium]
MLQTPEANPSVRPDEDEDGARAPADEVRAAGNGDRGELLGREMELKAMARGVATIRGGDGAVLAIEGAAGIGKTELLKEALRGARESGTQTLLATATPLETSFPFGVARQLFDPVRREVGEGAWAELSSGAARFAARALDEHALEAADPGDDPSFATLHGLYWLTANLTAESPLLLAVDDAQWADRPSLRFLSHLVRRLEGIPAVIVLAVRSGDPPTDTLLLSELVAAAEPALRLGPLGEREAVELVRSGLGEAELSLCAAVHRATGGNPFLLHALTGALATGEVERSAQAVDSLRGVRLEGVADALLRRLAVLPEGSHSLVTAAALGRDASLGSVAELAGLDPAAAARAAEALREAGILARRPSIAFTHPVVRAAVYEGMARDARRDLHLRAVDQLASRGASPEQAAVHYLAVEGSGDRRAVSALREAARQASSRGAPDVAASYLRRALVEPPDQRERPRVLVELGLAGLAAEEHDSPAHLAEAVRGIPDPRERAEVALEAAILLGFNGDSADVVSACNAGLRSRTSIDPDLAARLESEMALWSFLDPSTVESAVNWVRSASKDDDPLTAPAAAIGAAWVRLALEARPAPGEMDRLVAMVSAGSLFSRRSAALAMAATWVLVIGGRPDLTRDVGDAVVAMGEDQGSILLTRVGRFWRGVAEHDLGLIADAAADSIAAFEIALEGAGGAEGLSYSLSSVINSLVEAGDPDRAEAALASAGLPEDPPPRIGFALLLESRGRLRSAQGRLSDAAEDLLEAGRRWQELRVRSPVPTTWRGDAALVLDRLDRRDEALRLASEQLALARETEEPRTLGTSLRTLGEVKSGASARALLEEAVEVLEGAPARLELAKALLSLGRAMRKEGARAAAREPLARGLDIAHRGGIGRVAEMAREELRLAGARPRRTVLVGPDSLTPAERRVTALAAADTSNREIAQRLFVSLRTVETHLTHAYQKLDISSRDELAGAMTRES